MALSGILDEMEPDHSDHYSYYSSLAKTSVPLSNMINLGVGLKIFHHFISPCASETKLFEAGDDLRNRPFDHRSVPQMVALPKFLQASKTMRTQ